MARHMSEWKHRELMASIDKTPIGDQHVLPGAERITEAELAKRKAAESLKAAKPQRPCDHGLFSDDAAQIDLVDVLRNHQTPVANGRKMKSGIS